MIRNAVRAWIVEDDKMLFIKKVFRMQEFITYYPVGLKSLMKH